jgi:hypothetical protein
MEYPALQPIIRDVLPTGYHAAHADAAFNRAVRARRIASFRNMLRRCGIDSRLPVYDERSLGHGRLPLLPGRHEIPLHEIRATVEPNRAQQFDAEFRPTKKTRRRWERVWLAEHSGTVLPPIVVVPVEGGFALRDGHHRVSVARARGAIAIDAIVEGAATI